MKRIRSLAHRFLSAVVICQLLAPINGCADLADISPPPVAPDIHQIPLITVDAEPIKFANVTEIVTIDGSDYQVPEPWFGNRLFPTSLPNEALKPVPPEFSHNASKVYVLAEAYTPLVNLLDRARQDGIELQVESAYRSKSYQTRIFIRMFAQGRSFTDIIRYVAPPGYSQHMLGTAVDFYPSNWQFAETEQYNWLLEHGAEFGFEQTYSQYNHFKMPWESWHWNYVGLRGATEIGAAVPQEDGNRKNQDGWQVD